MTVPQVENESPSFYSLAEIELCVSGDLQRKIVGTVWESVNILTYTERNLKKKKVNEIFVQETVFNFEFVTSSNQFKF